MQNHFFMSLIMKQWRFIIWIVLLACIFDPVSTLTARADILATNQNKASLSDSLLKLDTLVKMYKVSNPSLAIQWAKRALVIAGQINSDEAKARAYLLLGIGYFQNQKDTSYIYYTLALKIADDALLLKLKAAILFNLANIYDAAGNHDAAIKMLNSSIVLAESIKDYKSISNAYNTLGSIKIDIQDFESAHQIQLQKPLHSTVKWALPLLTLPGLKIIPTRLLLS